MENKPPNIEGDHLSGVEDFGLAGFLVELHPIGEELGAKVSSLQGGNSVEPDQSLVKKRLLSTQRLWHCWGTSRKSKLQTLGLFPRPTESEMGVGLLTFLRK